MESFFSSVQRNCDEKNVQEETKASEKYKCEEIFSEYLRKFHVGHGQMKSVLLETDRTAKPSMILSAPTVQRSDRENGELIHLAMKICFQNEPLKRRRYVIVHFPEFLFILGAYDFDSIHQRRFQPEEDFLFEIKNETFRSIPTFPSPGRISFSVAPSKRYVVVVGGHTYENLCLNETLIFDIENIQRGSSRTSFLKRKFPLFCCFGWTFLPSYPHPVVAAGSTIVEDQLIVIGGYDIIAGEIDMISTHYQMDLNEKIWRSFADIHPARARSLVICLYRDENLEIFTAGGFTLTKAQPKLIDQIFQYDSIKNQWKKISDIPRLQINDLLTVAETKLIISEEVLDTNAIDSSSLSSPRIFDFETSRWNEESTKKNQ